MLVIYLAPLPRGFFLGTLGPFRFSLSGPMLRPRLRNLAKSNRRRGAAANQSRPPSLRTATARVVRSWLDPSARLARSP